MDGLLEAGMEGWKGGKYSSQEMDDSTPGRAGLREGENDLISRFYLRVKQSYVASWTPLKKKKRSPTLKKNTFLLFIYLLVSPGTGSGTGIVNIVLGNRRT